MPDVHPTTTNFLKIEIFKSENGGGGSFSQGNRFVVGGGSLVTLTEKANAGKIPTTQMMNTKLREGTGVVFSDSTTHCFQHMPTTTLSHSKSISAFTREQNFSESEKRR